MQNPKAVASIDRSHSEAMAVLKERWSARGSRIFSKMICDSAVIYGNLENSIQGRNILVLLDLYAPELRYKLTDPAKIDNLIVELITKYLQLNNVDLKTANFKPTEPAPEVPHFKTEIIEVKSPATNNSVLSGTGFIIDPTLFQNLGQG